MQAGGRPLSFCVMQTKQLPSKGTQHQLWRLTPLPGQSHLSLFRSPSLTPVSSEGTQIKQREGQNCHQSPLLPPAEGQASRARQISAPVSPSLPTQAPSIPSQVSAALPCNFWAALPAAQRFSVHLYLKAVYTHPSPPAPSVPPPTHFSPASQMVSSWTASSLIVFIKTCPEEETTPHIKFTSSDYSIRIIFILSLTFCSQWIFFFFFFWKDESRQPPL